MDSEAPNRPGFTAFATVQVDADGAFAIRRDRPLNPREEQKMQQLAADLQAIQFGKGIGS